MSRWLVVVLAIVFALAGRHAVAELDFDGEPPMTWADAQACARVVVAACDDADDDGGGRTTIRLKVSRVLRGAGVRAGDVLTVALEHRWRLVTDAAAEHARVEKGTEAPWLCYLEQFDSPGPLLPNPVPPSARTAAIYFLPDAAAPALRRRGQVQPTWLADGWERVLRGERADLLWRLRQGTDALVANEALEELADVRDPAVLDALFSRLAVRRNDRTRRAWEEPYGTAFLRSIGDRGGDVYDRTLRRLDDPSAASGIAEALALLCAESDPKRASVELAARLAPDRPLQVRTACAIGLGCVGGADALEAMLGLLEEKSPGPLQPFLADAAARSLETLLRTGGSWDARRRVADVARLRRAAWPRLLALPPAQRTSNLVHDLREALEPTERPTVADASAAITAACDGTLRSAEDPRWRTAQAVAASPSPEFVPALADALAAALHDTRHTERPYVFREIVQRHALVCRRAMFTAHAGRAARKLAHPSGYPVPTELSQWLGLMPQRPSESRSPADLAALLRANPREFATRVADVLGSRSPFERRIAAETLRRELAWEPASSGWESLVAARREPFVARARAMLARVAEATDEVSVRAIVLRSLGVELDGPPGRGWAAPLRAAAADDDPAVAENAVLLLGLLLGERDVAAEVLTIRTADRPQVVAVWLDDRGFSSTK